MGGARQRERTRDRAERNLGQKEGGAGPWLSQPRVIPYQGAQRIHPPTSYPTLSPTGDSLWLNLLKPECRGAHWCHPSRSACQVRDRSEQGVGRAWRSEGKLSGTPSNQKHAPSVTLQVITLILFTNTVRTVHVYLRSISHIAVSSRAMLALLTTGYPLRYITGVIIYETDEWVDKVAATQERSKLDCPKMCSHLKFGPDQ